MADLKEEELKKLLGDKLYEDLQEIKNRVANTDMCSIGKPIDYVNVLEGCYDTVLDKEQLKIERDKFIKDLEDKFMPNGLIGEKGEKITQEEIDLKNISQQQCLEQINEKISNIQGMCMGSGGHGRVIYFLLSSLFALVANLKVYKLLYPEKPIVFWQDIPNDFENIFFNVDDRYWSLVDRIEDGEFGIRNYRLHNFICQYFKNFITHDSYMSASDPGDGRPLIEIYYKSFYIEETDIIENFTTIEDKLNEKLVYFFDCLAYILLQIVNKVDENYNTLLMEAQADPELSQDIDGYIKTNIKRFYDQIQELYQEEWLDRDRIPLEGIPESQRRYIKDMTPESYEELPDNLMKKANIKYQKDYQWYFEDNDVLDSVKMKKKIIAELDGIKCLNGVSIPFAIKKGEEDAEQMESYKRKGVPKKKYKVNWDIDYDEDTGFTKGTSGIEEWLGKNLWNKSNGYFERYKYPVNNGSISGGNNNGNSSITGGGGSSSSGNGGGSSSSGESSSGNGNNQNGGNNGSNSGGSNQGNGSGNDNSSSKIPTDIDGVSMDGMSNDYIPDEKILDLNADPDDYDLLKAKYWLKYTGFLNLVSLLPMNWTIGLIMPPAIKIPLPIIYVFLTVIYIQPTLTVIWLTINGMVICPVIMHVDFSSGKAKSTWITLFRGGNQLIKDGGGCKPIPLPGLAPLPVNEQKPSKTAMVDTLVEVTKGLPFITDDFPPFKRLSFANPIWLKFLYDVCAKAKPFMGLP